MKMEYNSHKVLQLRVTTPVFKRGVLKAGRREDTSERYQVSERLIV